MGTTPCACGSAIKLDGGAIRNKVYVLTHADLYDLVLPRAQTADLDDPLDPVWQSLDDSTVTFLVCRRCRRLVYDGQGNEVSGLEPFGENQQVAEALLRIAGRRIDGD